MISGCFDRFVRVWDIQHKKVINWQQTAHFITALKITDCGKRLYVGLINGEVAIYDSSEETLSILKLVSCKNRRGKFSNGRKVTGIECISTNIAMITTNDSRIRFIDSRVT